MQQLLPEFHVVATFYFGSRRHPHNTYAMDDRELDLTEEQKVIKSKYPAINKKYECESRTLLMKLCHARTKMLIYLLQLGIVSLELDSNVTLVLMSIVIYRTHSFTTWFSL